MKLRDIALIFQLVFSRFYQQMEGNRQSKRMLDCAKQGSCQERH